MSGFDDLLDIHYPMDKSFRDYFTQTGIDLIKKKEEYLLQLIKALNITEEEFVKDYLIELHPIRVIIPDQFEDNMNHSYVVIFEEKFRVRRKTDEEIKPPDLTADIAREKGYVNPNKTEGL